MESSPRRRRVVPGKASSGHPGVGGPTTAWLQRHPVAAAAVYMLLGGCIGKRMNALNLDDAARHGAVRTHPPLMCRECFVPGSSSQLAGSSLQHTKHVPASVLHASRNSVRVLERQPGEPAAAAARRHRAAACHASSPGRSRSRTSCARHLQGVASSRPGTSVCGHLLQGGASLSAARDTARWPWRGCAGTCTHHRAGMSAVSRHGPCHQPPSCRPPPAPARGVKQPPHDSGAAAHATPTC